MGKWTDKPNLGAQPASDDTFLEYDASTGLIKQIARSNLVSNILTPSIISPIDNGITGSFVRIQGSIFSPLYESETRDYREFQVDLTSGDFSSPVVSTQVNEDSYDVSGLSYNTDYKARIRDVSNSGYTTAWSSEITFTTSEAIVYGIALVSTGGGAGTWQNIDANGNDIAPSTTDFDNHPVWGNISDVTIDGQDMVKIPKFWIKADTAPTGSDQAGKKCWWVGDAAFSGAAVHPAFMDSGAEIDQVYVGKYECTDDGDTKAGSTAGVAPLVDIDFPTMQTRCEARNEANGGNVGVSGFRMWDIYELAALQILSLIELGTPDVQSAIAAGRVDESSAANTGTTSAVWRGIYELWGNVWNMTDGLQIDGSHQVEIWDKNGNTTLQSTGITTVEDSDGWTVTLHDESGTDWDLGSIFLPASTDGTESNGTLADYLYASDAGEQNVCYSGGHWGVVVGGGAGLFILHLCNMSSASGTYV
ncbi:MAG: hypothetical protein R6U32_06390, partial [Candidatus Woesearchaeota archaeon]